jgi:hypothetical protein
VGAKLRTPKGRSPPISAEALKLFRRGLALQKAGKTDVWRRGTCEYLHDVWQPLHIALGLAPWEMSPLDCPEEPPTRLLHLCITQSWPKVHRIKLALEEADRADRESRQQPPSAKAEPEGGGDGGE